MRRVTLALPYPIITSHEGCQWNVCLLTVISGWLTPLINPQFHISEMGKQLPPYRNYWED